MTTLELRERLAFTQIMHETPEVQDRFWKMIEGGEKAQAALMFATCRAPGVKGGDRVFNEQARRRMQTEPQMDKILDVARKAGISTQGKYYCGGLGRYDDPAAWVSTTDDVMAVAKKRGYIVNGAVKHDPGTPDPRPPVEMAPDLVREIGAKYIDEDPRLKEKMKKDPVRTSHELKEMVIAKHGKRKP